MKEIKCNKIIAYKKDFNIEEYQKTLLKLLSKKMERKFYNNLEESYKIFNQKTSGRQFPRGRFYILADKLKDFINDKMIEKIKLMDKSYKLYLKRNQ